MTARHRQLIAPAGPPQRARGAEANPPYPAEVRGALRDALAEALARGHNYIGTGHILLGLYRSADSLAAGILQSAGADQAEAKVRLNEMLRAL